MILKLKSIYKTNLRLNDLILWGESEYSQKCSYCGDKNILLSTVKIDNHLA